MPRIVTTLEFAKTSKDRTWQMMTRVYEQLARVINGQVNIGKGWNAPMVDANQQLIPNTANPNNCDNQQGAVVYCTFGAANSDLLIRHNLKYIPRCYIPLWKAVACDIYDGTGQSGTTPYYSPPGLGLFLNEGQTRVDGTSPYTTVSTSTILLRSTVANAEVLLLIF